MISVGDPSLQEASVRSVRSVGSVGYTSPTDCTDQHKWLVALVRPRNPRNSQKFGCVSGCVGMAGCHTLLYLCKSVLSVGDPSLQEASVRSVDSVGYSSSTDCTDQHRWVVALIRPRNSQNSQKFGCVSGCVGMAGCHTLLICVNPCYLWETLRCKKLLCVPCVLWEYGSPTDCTDQHRWLVALVAAWVRQDAIPSYICVNPCYLWETFLCKKLLCVPWVLWEYSSPTDCTDSHR